jgi:hypothetical protein
LGLVFAKLRLPLSCVAQTDCLSIPEFWGIDDATKENFDKLEKKAGDLTKEVSKRNFATGELHAIPDGGSNEQALRR